MSSPVLVNLLGSKPKPEFDHTKWTRDLDYTFGRDYFDGERHKGYGGYKYDGRWKAIVKQVATRYGLSSKSKVLDVGCAKGFFVHDAMEEIPGLQAWGLEVSTYAIENAHGLARGRIKNGSADALPFADKEFDFVAGFNVLHFLTPDRCEVGLREIMRVAKDVNSFIQVDAFTNDLERARLMAWSGGIKTVYSCDDWLKLFAKLGYRGDYYWTII
jgi:ubiquinone/menaquinone biosynthesis C-methylase UbiE